MPRVNHADMRLAVNGRFLTQDTTGTQRYALELTTRLVERHPGRIVVHAPKGAVIPPELAREAVVRQSRATGQFFEQVALPWAARGDLLLSLGGPAPVAARRQVATLHDVSVFRHPYTYSRAFRTWYRFMYRVLACRSLRVLTVSAFSARELGAVLGVGDDRVTIVPNGSDHVDGLVPERPPFELDGHWVLCVGTFAQHKNLVPALDAFEAAGVRSVVVGARGSRRVFAATDTGRWTRASFAGRLTDAELAWLYRHATALVFPSIYEGFGIPVVEAQRLGCPVVALRVDPMPEVTGDGAMLCDPGRPRELVAAVRRLVEDPAQRAALIQRGHLNAQRYTWEGSAEVLVRTLGELGWAPDGGPGEP